ICHLLLMSEPNFIS
ncbi:hypothetical protein TYRP_016583, partial [Tyrophagus putrescentiae]